MGFPYPRWRLSVGVTSFIPSHGSALIHHARVQPAGYILQDYTLFSPTAVFIRAETPHSASHRFRLLRTWDIHRRALTRTGPVVLEAA